MKISMIRKAPSLDENYTSKYPLGKYDLSPWFYIMGSDDLMTLRLESMTEFQKGAVMKGSIVDMDGFTLVTFLFKVTGDPAIKEETEDRIDMVYPYEVEYFENDGKSIYSVSKETLIVKHKNGVIFAHNPLGLVKGWIDGFMYKYNGLRICPNVTEESVKVYIEVDSISINGKELSDRDYPEWVRQYLRALLKDYKRIKARFKNPFNQK